MGRKTLLTIVAQEGKAALPGLDIIVYSQTLRPADYPYVTVISGAPSSTFDC